MAEIALGIAQPSAIVHKTLPFLTPFSAACSDSGVSGQGGQKAGGGSDAAW